MQINRIRLLGFKSFVEPTELVIETGLTGVVGPNGCGKSNLLEALRWVMGETSHKSMRAAAMDDVIFAGTTTRPARNVAEVTLFLDNSARSAPAEWNAADVIEITRRIEREAGSAYRINGADVRARDVKILFEDAATGARSPALVRQGQISEIVNAKPEQRRRILEDAAGVAGLHSRRHDAELRLKAAEANLARLADILGSYTSQIEGLKRQARQARRYREISVDIRKAEAVSAHVSWSDAAGQLEIDLAELAASLSRLGAAVEAEAKAVVSEAALADTLQPLRDEEATSGAILARLKIEQANLDREATRAVDRQRELQARLGQLDADIVREAALTEEATEALARLDSELEEMAIADDGAADAEDEARSAVDAARRAETEAAGRLAELTRRDFDMRARARSLEAGLAERREQAQRLTRQLASIEDQLRGIQAQAPEAERLDELKGVEAELTETIETAEQRTADIEDRVRLATAETRSRRDAAAQANLDLRGIDAEHATLTRMLRPRSGDGFTPVLDAITVTPGYEGALGAALGDDLDAPVGDDGGYADAASGDETAAPLLHWRLVEPHTDDPTLPDGVEALATKVKAPPALARRLAQIGIVEAVDGTRLQATLKPGQRLVSRAGDLWRWDGFVANSDAPTAAAERLAQRNRLAEIGARQDELRSAAERASAAEKLAQAALQAAEEDGRKAHLEAREAQSRLVRTREELARVERAQREAQTRLATLDEARAQAADAVAEAQGRVAESEATLEALEEMDSLDDEISAGEAVLTEARGRVVQLSAAAAGIERERKLRAERLVHTKAERQRWSARSEAADRQVATLRTRAEETRAELAELAELPAEIETQRQRLMTEIAQREAERTAAADKLANADNELREARQALRASQVAVATEREARARIEARLEGTRARHADESRRIRETLQCEPDACLALAGFPADAQLPTLEEIDRQLTRLKADRERLGGVNLAADDELQKLAGEFDALDKERADVEEAIAKLRGAIGQLNREGKKRIDEAFQAVNAHFQALFTTLFNGGEARLEMLEGEDPLEGGLEIVAKPPGKKPATLSLLSGGEQTLTALSLIFAVFLTNPSPICVLDEVDAPLDDANVDRFATLMEKMAAETATRFLVITHHPMTMARMNRLFGVTMGEKGVSQLVSVDLASAERIVADEPRRAVG